MARRTVPIALPSVGEEEWQALREPIESGWLTQGPVVQRFEAEFARRHAVAHALATTSCTTALHLALAALGVGPGDQVIVPSFTWIATANAVVFTGAEPVFVDVLDDTYNLDPAGLARVVTSRTRAVIPVHLFGLCADMEAIRDVVGPSIAVVEDAACAAGGSHLGRPAGSLGDVGCFSFHPRKSITTGEGGMLVTGDASLAERAERLRNHGAAVPEEVRHRGAAPYLLPDFDELGFNYRMTDLQAAVGLVQLGKLDTFVAERAEWAKWYGEELAQFEWLHLPHEPEHGRHAWQSFVTVLADDAPVERDVLMQRLHELGVATRPGTHCVPTLGYYRERSTTGADAFRVARRLQDRTMAIPLHNRMTSDDYTYVIECIRSAVARP
jgi:dTDP-4-amino-4,6-dideoxygalactose transaminase